MSVNKITIDRQQYVTHKREGDGICGICFEFSYGVADPMADHVYCDNCENRALVGIDMAIKMGLVEVAK